MPMERKGQGQEMLSKENVDLLALASCFLMDFNQGLDIEPLVLGTEYAEGQPKELVGLLHPARKRDGSLLIWLEVELIDVQKQITSPIIWQTRDGIKSRVRFDRLSEVKEKRVNSHKHHACSSSNGHVSR
jgi:hypothetical protein